MPSISDYQAVITRFNHIFRQTPDLVIELEDASVTVVKITFYFKSAFYGETKMRVREWFDADDNKIQYRYAWEKNNTKPGHISAWENEHHNIPHGLDTDPHHHHHVPGDRTQLQANYRTRELEIALERVEEYIVHNKQYDGRLV